MPKPRTVLSTRHFKLRYKQTLCLPEDMSTTLIAEIAIDLDALKAGKIDPNAINEALRALAED